MGDSPTKGSIEGIAVIGMACRFPGAKSIEQFWQNLSNGIESITFFSDEELKAAGVAPELLNNANYVKAKPKLADYDLFDAPFFGLSPREAEIMDPQQRLFLETAWEGLESSGYISENYTGRIGVYAGVGTNTYLLRNILSNPQLVDSFGVFQTILANDKDYLATRVSYKLNLKGPSIDVQSACSTSLVAICLACQSLLTYQSDITLVGGVTIASDQQSGYLYQEGGILSPDGHCRAFDAKAQGTVAGNGVGVVVLKRLADAIEDGDTIHAVITGSALNNDGSLKIGYTAPSADGQAEVITEAQLLAGVEPESITYVETHGTGTHLGDPIEIAGLTKAFRAFTEKRNFCAIGSVKTNFGHLDAAAGVAGLIKTVLALKHKMLPPSLHFDQPNPQIDFASSPFYVNNQLKEWKVDHLPRRAGVSSFGIGGTNAHLIVEEAPLIEGSNDSKPWQVLVLSAKSATALEMATTNLAEFLTTHEELNLADIAYTLQLGRREFNFRRALVCNTVKGAKDSLHNGTGLISAYTESGQSRHPILFMFPGGGAQYINMGRELYEQEPVFREQVDICAQLLKPYAGFDVRDYLYPDETKAEEREQQFTRTSIALPALFVIEYALAKLWFSLGIQPTIMIGHSLGEYTAACLAGTFSLEDALSLVALRGQLFERLPKGAMLSVALPEAELQFILDKNLSLAAINGPSLCLVSGSVEAIREAEERLTKKGIEFQRLFIDVAAHSPLVEPILDEFVKYVKKLRLQPPKISWISNLSGHLITAREATDADYWARHLRQTVRFADGLGHALKQSECVLLEVGPGRSLASLARQHPHKTEGQAIINSLRHPQEQQSDEEFFLNMLSRLWLLGINIDWSARFMGEHRSRIPLPTYPFEKVRYWIEANSAQPNANPSAIDNRNLLLEKKPDIADWFFMPSWQRSTMPARIVSTARFQWLIFIDEQGLGTQLAQALEESGHSVIMVTVGPTFAKLSEHAYSIDPARPDNYRALLKELIDRDCLPSKIVHMWNVAAVSAQPLTGETVSASLPLIFYSLIYLVQALAQHNIVIPIELSVISNNLQDITGEEQLCPEKALILGPCKVIPQEYPNITCHHIDILLPTTEANTIKLVGNLLREVQGNSSAQIIGYRHDYRWEQTFVPFRMERVDQQTRLREYGVYLIAGGLGQIGLVLAEYLARDFRAKLVLIGRSNFPARACWAQWLTDHGEEDAISRKIAKLQMLEAMGGEVLVECADINDEKQIRAVLEKTQAQFGPINGVINSVLYAEQINCPVNEIDIENANAHFQGKVYGTLLLAYLLSDKPLDFYLTLSSVAAVLGGLGLSSYSAANNFLDAFALKQRRDIGGCWLSVNWDAWMGDNSSTDPLSPGQPSADYSAMQELLAKIAITPAEGIELFRRIFSTSETGQIMLSTWDLPTRLEHWLKRGALPVKQLANGQSSSLLHNRPDLESNYIAPRNEVEQKLAEIWQQVLGVAQIGVEDSFFELGGDSIIGLQIIAKANQAGLQLSRRHIFQYPTIAKLATVVGTEQIVAAEQGIVTGELPLTPVQKWFFAQPLVDAHHFNHVVLLEMQQGVEEKLAATVRHLLLHHDSLRLRFVSEANGWRQFHADLNEPLPFSSIDLSELTLSAKQQAITDHANQLQRSLDLTAGPLLRVAYFHFGQKQPGRLLIIVHHLAIDSDSWLILLQDLDRIYGQLIRDEEASLPPKTVSYQEWARQLMTYASEKDLTEDLAYWVGQPWNKVARLPRDLSCGENSLRSEADYTITFRTEETQFLLREATETYGTQIVDLLLYGLVKAIGSWAGLDMLLVNLESPGREDLIAGIDISRTVGWFTSIFPVLLDLTGADNPDQALKMVRDHLRGIPKGGVTYGLLYYGKDEEIARQLQTLPQAEVSFLYLGQSDQMLAESAIFKPATEATGEIRSKDGNRFQLLDLTAGIFNGQLQVTWTYSKNIHQPESIIKLANVMAEALRAFIVFREEQPEQSYLPNDFTDMDLSPEQLAQILAEVEGDLSD